MTRRFLNACCAVAVAMSWLIMAGLPASAAVTGSRVEAPKNGAVIAEAAALVVVVDWTPAPPREKLAVRTRLVDSDGQFVGEGENGTILYLNPAKRSKAGGNATEGPSEQRRFQGTINPHDLAWQPGGGVAPNGNYHLQYQWETSVDGPDENNEPDPESIQRGDWQMHRFVLDAPPAPQTAPSAAVANPKKRTVTVGWPANGAPDLTSYTVHRKAEGGSWEVARHDIVPGTTEITDTVPADGTYRYRVVAAREAADPSDQPRTATSPASATVTVSADATEQPTEGGSKPRKPLVDKGALANLPRLSDNDTEPSTSTGGGGTAFVPRQSTVDVPRFAAPDDFEDTYKGPLDYGVEPREVTERVPVDIAEGGAQAQDDTLTVVDTAIDQERVLPPLAGGLILIVSAAHVLRYLNE